MKNYYSTKIQPTVLIVDDNPNNIKVIALSLRVHNYKIVIATNGKDAIEMVNTIRPDLVLLDVMMPGMDGYQACEIIKSDKKNENIPVLFLTALNNTDSIVKGFEAGGVDYITKPFNQKELIIRIKTHLALKKTRDDLETAMENLSKLNLLKDKIFSVIGHDLRSPLGSVKMTLEFLLESKKGLCPEECLSNFDMMKNATDEIIYLLENLMGWGKAQSGTLIVNPEILKLDEVLNSIILLYKANITLKKINLVNKLPPGFSAFADLNTIKIVMRNLISNAIKFTPEGGTIKVKGKQTNGQVKLTIQDKGIGIPEKHLLKLFDPESYLTTYGTNKETGSGLGLKLCYDFIKRNKGNIQVESEVDKGSSFIISLPAAEKEESNK
jgi:two-component system, sensor histidine kinase and response regulator